MLEDYFVDGCLAETRYDLIVESISLTGTGGGDSIDMGPAGVRR